MTIGFNQALCVCQHTGTRRRRWPVGNALQPGRYGQAASDASEQIAGLATGDRDRPGEKKIQHVYQAASLVLAF
jgi:hypothetical protein